MARFFPVAGAPSLPPLPPAVAAAAGRGTGRGRSDDSVPRSQAASFSPDEEKERNTGREIDGRRPCLPFALRRLPPGVPATPRPPRRRPPLPRSNPRRRSSPFASSPIYGHISEVRRLKTGWRRALSPGRRADDNSVVAANRIPPRYYPRLSALYFRYAAGYMQSPR